MHTPTGIMDDWVPLPAHLAYKMAPLFPVQVGEHDFVLEPACLKCAPQCLNAGEQ